MSTVFCPMIHGGLNIDLKHDGRMQYNQCCLSTTPLNLMVNDRVDWNNKDFEQIRNINRTEQWLPGCWQCENLEKVGVKSFRLSMIEKFGMASNLTGPQRIDLLFDRSCNLACRTCGPHSSTLWIKELKQQGKFTEYRETSNLDKIKSVLAALDLSNLGMIQFCGGETLLGNTYWHAAEYIASLVPDAKQKLTLGFQTNGTQSIDPRYFEIIDQFHLVKLMISIDGIGTRFEYLRWPAVWNQVRDNLLHLRETLPSNVMFFVQECTSCLNLWYYQEVQQWLKENFATNREGDAVDHTTQLVKHDYLNPQNITWEYYQALDSTIQPALGEQWQENPDQIRMFLKESSELDQIRGQDWKLSFPDIVDFYSRYL